MEGHTCNGIISAVEVVDRPLAIERLDFRLKVDS